MSMNVSPVHDKLNVKSLEVEKKGNVSTGSLLLEFAGTWQGEDFEECLVEVYKTRGETSF